VVNAQGDKTNHMSRLRRFAASVRRADNDKYKDYHFTLTKLPRAGKNQGCLATCAGAYKQLTLQDNYKRGDDKKSIANEGILHTGCALYTFKIDMPGPAEVKPDIQCGDSKSHFSAPEYDSNGNGATSVEAAIKTWCTESNQF
jgi:hypothetical protein